MEILSGKSLTLFFKKAPKILTKIRKIQSATEVENSSH